MKISEQLLQCAAEVRRGWCQCALEDESGGVCAHGAIHRVVAGKAKISLTQELHYNKMPLVEYLWKALGHCRIASWNNAPDQTQENVAATFELAAILAEQDEARIGVSETKANLAEVMLHD